MAHYELKMVSDNGGEDCDIGDFKSEAELEKWARENKNALKDNYPEG